MTALRAFFAIGIAGFWLALFAPPMFQTPPAVYTGVHLLSTQGYVTQNVIRVDRGSPAYRAGLRTGDVLGCMTTRDFWLLMAPSWGSQQGYTPGTVISACAYRGGATIPVRFVAQTRGIVENAYGSNALAALRVCVVLVFFLTGVALVMGRPSLMTWIFYAYCIGSAPSFAAEQVWAILPSWAHAIAMLVVVSGQTAVAFLLLFAVIVPNSGIPVGWRRTVFYTAAFITLLDVIYGFVSTYYTGITFLLPLGNTIDETLTVVTVLFILARLFTMERAERARFGWAAFAIIFGVVANDLRNVLSIGPYANVSVIAADMTVVMPLCLLYAILKRHVIDVRFVISRTVVYAAVTTLVIVVIGVVDWLTSTYLSQAKAAMAIDAAVTIGIAFVLHRGYRSIERTVDALLYRRKHRAEIYLLRLAKTLLRSEREETIDRELVQAPYEKLELTMAALLRAQDESFAVSCAAGWELSSPPVIDREHELVRFLNTERTKLEIRDLRAHIAEEFQSAGTSPAFAIPIFQGDELAAFAVYGIHRDGTQLDPDEIEALEDLCDVAAQAYVRIELLRYRSLVTSPIPAIA
jgi:hypothetical protein